MGIFEHGHIVVLAMLTLSTSVLATKPMHLPRGQVTTVVATVTVSVAASTQPASPQYTNTNDFHTSLLNSTNFFRYEHNATALSWNSSLASYAQRWAERCVFMHSHGPHGENLAMGFPNMTMSVEGWGDERIYYDFNRPTGFSEPTGHFTQLVWKDTTSTGCAVVDCTGKPHMDGWFVVCEYWPPGNIVGENNLWFKQNVQKQIHQSGPSATVASRTVASRTVASPTAAASANSTGRYGIGNEGSSHQVATRVWTVAAVGAALVLAAGMI